MRRPHLDHGVAESIPEIGACAFAGRADAGHRGDIAAIRRFGREGAELGVKGAQEREFAPRRAHEISGGAHDTITEHEQTRPSCVLRDTRTRGAPTNTGTRATRTATP